MQQILCFEIVQSKVQLSNRKVALEVEELTTRELWLDGRGGGAAWKDKTMSLNIWLLPWLH